MGPPVGARGVLALHLLLIDACLLFGRGIFVPPAVRKHWATEPLWIVMSFLGISLGLREITAVAEGWLGPALQPEAYDRKHDENIAVAFASVSYTHLTLPTILLV